MSTRYGILIRGDLYRIDGKTLLVNSDELARLILTAKRMKEHKRGDNGPWIEACVVKLEISERDEYNAFWNDAERLATHKLWDV